MRIAVLVNNYNYARFLEACLDSVRAQTRAPDEVIVVDDGSTDDSRAVLARYAAEHPGLPLQVVEKANGGQLSAFNRGFSSSSADVLCFLDSDDAFEPGYLARVEEFFRAHPETEMYYSSFYRQFEDGSRTLHVLPERELPPQLLETAYLLRYCGGPTSTIAIRREALSRILPYPQEAAWRVSADDILVMKAAALGLRRFTDSRPLVQYRIHGNNHFHGRRMKSADRQRIRERRLQLLAPDLDRLATLSDAARAALFLRQLAVSPRASVPAYRNALLVLRMPLPLLQRLRCLGAYLHWLVSGPSA